MVGNILRAAGIPDARVMELSDERDTWTRRITDEARKGYEAGYADGLTAGYLRGVRELETSWPPLVRNLPGPTLAELELLRWGPGGRERAAEPRLGDRFSFRTGRLSA